MLKVAVLGPNTYSEESAEWFLQHLSCELLPCKTIAEVFEASASGRTDYSVVPIENTIEGSVSLHIDWLVHDVELPIQAEWTYPIAVNLIAFPDAEHTGLREERLRSIRKVISHPVALAQCRKFLAEHLPWAEQEQAASTSEAVRLLKESGDKHSAAVGAAAAANRYGLELLATSIQDNQNNFTRFVLAGAKPLPGIGQSGPMGLKPVEHKTTLLLMPDEDFPGGLHQLLSAFAWRRLNLSKIESRPTKRKLGTYYFYIDVQASLDSVLLQGAVEEIKAVGCQVRIMGSYPSYTYAAASDKA
ncbi:prephenate dehydratase [Paenibacillus thermotolerans]|uniref:prephenate dehydratase n=1 Tax=Paenibacillus thermotolerans TaxID=3027807 RepID=UPI002368368E|nr:MULTISPECIES: prephenate dehydratase [unclassified Paenibacillus]